MPELIWIVDAATGDLAVEGLGTDEALSLAGDLLPPPREFNCARPLTTTPLPLCGVSNHPTLRVAAIWHASVAEGPGRRSVLQVQGCPVRCSPACFVPESHSSEAGVVLPVDILVDALLDPVGEPRDGVSVLGGEPFGQPYGLTALLRLLKTKGIHTLVYSGYTLHALSSRPDPAVHAALALTDLLVDGPYIEVLADGAGEWRGSRNQRIIALPGRSTCA